MSYILHSTSSYSVIFVSHHRGCDFPPTIDHGQYERHQAFGIFSRTEAIYKCDKGYTLVGEARLSCSSSGWSPAAPQCKGNSCSLSSQVGGNVTKAPRVQLLPARGSTETFDVVDLKSLLCSGCKHYKGATLTSTSPGFLPVINLSPIPTFKKYSAGATFDIWPVAKFSLKLSLA